MRPRTTAVAVWTALVYPPAFCQINLRMRARMANLFSNYAVFLKQFFRRYRTTGAILPSSRPLASALCRYVRSPSGAGRQILEVGPGTGAVTERLAHFLAADDRLTLVELNDDFVAHLRTRFARERAFQAVFDRTKIVHGRLEELEGAGCYDLIVSGLPLNNFAVADVERILNVFARLLKPEGVLSFFEYIAVRHAKTLVSGAAERRRVKQIGELLKALIDQHQIRRDAVWLNVTPAWVHHVRFGAAPADINPMR